MYHVVSQPQCIQIESSSTLLRTLKVMVYITTAVSAVFLIVDMIILATSLDPSFILPFILALFVFAVKIMDIVGLYLALQGGERYRTLSNIMLSVGLVVLSLTSLVIAVEIIGFSKNLLSVLTNPFVLYFSLIILTDLLALIYNNIVPPVSLDPRAVKPYWTKQQSDEGVVYVTEMCQIAYVPRNNYQ